MYYKDTVLYSEYQFELLTVRWTAKFRGKITDDILHSIWI